MPFHILFIWRVACLIVYCPADFFYGLTGLKLRSKPLEKMSVPQTGKFEAVVDGFVCQFDGDRWISTDFRLADTLNTALSLCPKQQYDLRSLAEKCLQMADYGGRYTVTRVQGNTLLTGNAAD